MRYLLVQEHPPPPQKMSKSFHRYCSSIDLEFLTFRTMMLSIDQIISWIGFKKWLYCH